MIKELHKRSAHIDAPVEKVFTFLADPEQYYPVREGSRGSDLKIRDVKRDADGVVHSYKVVQPIDIGRLTAELFRAGRLVVDTGIHHKGWTREEAIEYMLVNTGMAESDVVSEIERYIVLPGQATAYKVGMMKILELREKAMNALGDSFDLRDFHDVVLKNGAVPLDILERIVDDYIASTLAAEKT